MDTLKSTIQIIDKKKKSYIDLRQIVLNIRNQTLKMSDVVIENGLNLVQKYKNRLGDEYYIILEEIFLAGLEVGTLQTLRLSQKCLKQMKYKFPNSDKVDRMEALFYEASKDESHCLDILTDKVQANLLDTDSQKRKLSLLRREGHLQRFIEEMNSYLAQNSSDGEAWMELGDLYLETLNYNKAVYCYEELIVLFPKKFFYMMKIAEIYYTIGGPTGYQNAKHYYSFILSKDSNCYRAQWGLIQTCKKLLAIKKDDAKTQELLNLLLESIKGQYKKNGSEHIVKNINWNNYLK